MRTISKTIIKNIFFKPSLNFLSVKKNNIWKWYTFSDLYSHFCYSRKLLEDKNIKKGDRVAYKGSNSLEWISWNLATNSIGAIWVPMYHNQNIEYCKYIINDCNPKLFITDDLSLDINVNKINNTIQYNNINSNQKIDFVNSELATLIYTSGTSGGPKGVMLTNENILSNVDALLERFKDRPQTTSLNILPWAHIYSQTSELYFNIINSNSMALSSSKENFIKECREVKPDVLYVVPRILDLIKEKLDKFDKPIIRIALPHILKYILGNNIQTIFLGGAKLHEDTKKFYLDNNIILCEGYGTTETSPIISVNHVVHPRNINSIGKIVDNVVVEIINNEIQVSGPNVMIGYWNNETATQNVMVNRNNKLWYKTGDSGYIDKNGFLYYNGRINDNYKLNNGKFVDVQYIESIIKKYIKGNFIIFGENMKYNNLITDENITTETLTLINKNIDPYLRLKQVYNINSTEFNNFLTPKMSIKRKELITYVLNK